LFVHKIKKMLSQRGGGRGSLKKNGTGRHEKGKEKKKKRGNQQEGRVQGAKQEGKKRGSGVQDEELPKNDQEQKRGLRERRHGQRCGGKRLYASGGGGRKAGRRGGGP